jgi:two-component sensor histidine kinase
VSVGFLGGMERGMTIQDVGNSRVETTSDGRREPAYRPVSSSLWGIADVVRLQAARVADDGLLCTGAEIAGLLEGVAARIDIIEHLENRALAAAGESVDAGEYVRQTCAALIGALPFAGVIQLSIPQRVLRIGPDKAAALGLIVVELLTNAIAYAHPSGVPGLLRITCALDGFHELLVQVADDGVGLPDGFDLARHGGLGLAVVQMLSDRLGATLELRSTSLGLIASVRLPVAEHVLDA